MDLRELKLLNKKSCCNHEFTTQDIKMLKMNKDHKFYGGRIEFYSETKCPECGENIVLLLEPYANSYRIVDVGIDTSKDVEPIEINIEEEIKEEVKDFVCPNCNREFKTKAGLSKHIKSCQ